MTAIFAVTFVMSAVLICKWTLISHYDDADDNGNGRFISFCCFCANAWMDDADF